MEKIQTGLLIAHTLIAIIIIILVLLQRGKGADAGAAFGAGASGTVFGSRGSGSFFSRATAVLATVFFATSLTLAYFSSQSTGGPTSLLESAQPVEAADALAVDGQELPALDEVAEDADNDGLPSLPPEEGVISDSDELPSMPADGTTDEH